MIIIVFDTETTGLPQSRIISQDTLKCWPHIVQFSYIIYDLSANTIADVNDHIIKMQKNVSIPEESTNIHGITNQISIKNGDDIEKVFPEFFRRLQYADILVGHNIEFDINMIKVELLRIIYEYPITYRQSKIYRNYLHKITHFKNIYCTLKESIEICNIQAINKFGKSYLKYPKLIELHQTLFNTTPNNLHNSLNDILVTLRCFMKLKYDNDLLKTSKAFKRVSDKMGLF